MIMYRVMDLSISKTYAWFYDLTEAEDYLKEIREALGLDLYSKEQEIADNIRDKANIIQEKLISYQITTDDYILENLIKMTPLTNHMQLDMEMFKNIKNVTKMVWVLVSLCH